MKIQEILSACEKQIEQEHSPQLRSEVLLSLLKVERDDKKNITLTNRTFTAVEMINDMDNNDLLHELNYAIILLTDYQKSQSFSIALPSNAYSKEFADKLNSIKDQIEIIINKYQTD